MPKNSVLFTSRAPIGYVAISSNECCTNQGFKSIVPNENTDFMFLYYLLKFNKDNIENMGSGTTFKEVSGNTMKNIKVKVPANKTELKDWPDGFKPVGKEDYHPLELYYVWTDLSISNTSVFSANKSLDE